MSNFAEAPRNPASLSVWRRLLEITALALVALLLLRALCVEPFSVPTGSMAPALIGCHKAIQCPHCGYPVVVGVRDGSEAAAFCPYCGQEDLNLDEVAVCPGDQLLVNKTAFDWRRPRRWEMAVFRCPVDPDRVFVKRVVGLPGETVQVQGGDVWVDHDIARKTLAEFKSVRIPVVDMNYVPQGGWQGCWQAGGSGTAEAVGSRLRFDATGAGHAYHWLGYHQRRSHAAHSQAFVDECAYNGKEPARAREPVHDFQVECDLDVPEGDGWVAVGITDGLDDLVAELPVGGCKDGARLIEVEGQSPGGVEKTFRTAPGFALQPARPHHVELAFVDRRATLVVDGALPFAPVDRPAAEWRDEVTQPVRLGACGVRLEVRNLRLFRDVHYTASGQHGVRAPVRLGAGEYFVLGDNSPNSDDSRFWTGPDNHPATVSESSFVGKPFLVHLPGRIATWEALGRHGQHQALDWSRVRWLR
jgi:signal peptidase I